MEWGKQDRGKQTKEEWGQTKLALVSPRGVADALVDQRPELPRRVREDARRRRLNLVHASKFQIQEVLRAPDFEF